MKKNTIERKNIDKIRAVSKDIIMAKLLTKSEIDKINNRFYKIMRKHGICESTRTKGQAGRICNNFEWTMCRELFLDQVRAKLDISSFLSEQRVPQDLLAYKVNEVLND